MQQASSGRRDHAREPRCGRFAYDKAPAPGAYSLRLAPTHHSVNAVRRMPAQRAAPAANDSMAQAVLSVVFFPRWRARTSFEQVSQAFDDVIGAGGGHKTTDVHRCIATHADSAHFRATCN